MLRFHSILIPLLFAIFLAPLFATQAESISILTEQGSFISASHLRYEKAHFYQGDKKLVDFIECRFTGQSAQWYPSLFTIDGQRFSGTLKKWSKRKGITWETPEGKEILFPLLAVESIILKGQKKVVQHEQVPYLQLDNGKPVFATINFVTPKSISVKSEFGKLKLDRNGVQSIQLKKSSKRIQKGSHSLITKSGHRLFGDIQVLNDEYCTFKANGMTLKIPKSDLHHIRSMKYATFPKSFTHKSTPFLQHIDEPVWNRNAKGEDLIVDGTPIWEGLSLHSKTLCTFKLKKPISHFVFRIAMDHSYPYIGPCVLKLKSGAITKTWDLNHTTKTQWQSIALKGAKELSLTLDYGEKGSSGDRFILADPLFIPVGGVK